MIGEKPENPVIRRINRTRTIARYCELTGLGKKYREVSMTHKEVGGSLNGAYEYNDVEGRREFISYIAPAVERFCGEWYTEGRNPDWFPHPIFIATHLIHGRNDAIKECIEKSTPNAKALAKALVIKTYQLMHEHNMFRKERKDDENAQ